MQWRGNILFQYTVIIFLAVLLVSLGLAYSLSRQITSHLIHAHITLFPQVVKTFAHETPEIFDFLRQPAGTSPSSKVEHLMEDLRGFGAVFRVKIWGADATVLWSDRPELIGKNFSDNENLQLALAGKVSAERKWPSKSENEAEQGRGLVLEIYTPLGQDGQIVGVIELYESDAALFEQIRTNNRLVGITVSAAGLGLYLLLFGVFRRAYHRQRLATEELIQTQDATIAALAHQAELRDLETGEHLERTALYVKMLTEALVLDPLRSAQLNQRLVQDLIKSTPLHDIGKVGVPDEILRKPGKLTAEEFAAMKRHCEYGAAILQRAQDRLPFQSFLGVAIDIVRYHHERWNGLGYPYGLKAEAIPLSARIMALADVYDALRSRRYYKDAMPHPQCVEIIQGDSGSHFDPQVVVAFLTRAEEFRKISEEMAD